jgi:hypothetical protein
VQVFPPGLYWLAYEQDTSTGTSISLGIRCIIGIIGNSTSFTAPIYCYTVAHTYGALPDPYTGSATPINTTPANATPFPAIGLRPI